MPPHCTACGGHNSQWISESRCFVQLGCPTLNRGEFLLFQHLRTISTVGVDVLCITELPHTPRTWANNRYADCLLLRFQCLLDPVRGQKSGVQNNLELVNPEKCWYA